ncbi:PDE9A [Branchiostoma lanceolatum]|uniref:Phosphodiesterase n=1 Tax=Branchiostoma lanceolatum TaxID=7740 RepID=A0A8J9W8P0_BRALA|nr:PDE9A [Branchiostoma lanceolatum]
MATKVIYFTVGGRPEQAEFRSDSELEDVRECFRAAAEAGPNDILKLYNTKGNIVNISPKLEANRPDSRYKLQVVAATCNGPSASELGFDVNGMERRLEDLERKILVESGETPPLVFEMRKKVECFREKLESVEHLSWLGLFKDISSGTSSPFWNKKGKARKSLEHCKLVHDRFKTMSAVQVTEDVRFHLRKPTFDNWQWDDAEMLLLLQQMYIELDLLTKFNIEMPVLQQFLYEVYRHYNQIPFHNFNHAFCVTQMMYGIIWLCEVWEKLSDVEVLVMLTSALCHDLDHPGYNNAYQVNARTELALRYNDISPLENHHCAIAFEILEKPDCNIFRNLSVENFKKVREGMIRCILATDMARHNEILGKFKGLIPEFDFSNKEHKEHLMMILMKVSDISNEARPMDVAEPWLDCLLKEFFNQSDVEKLEGLPVTPFMDREKVTKPSSQTGFIQFVLLPLFEAAACIFPEMQPHIIQPVRDALQYYKDMQVALEDQNTHKKTHNDGERNSDGVTLRSPLETEVAVGLANGHKSP